LGRRAVHVTLDWYGHEDAEDAGEGGHKCAHIIALDNGNFCRAAQQPHSMVLPCVYLTLHGKTRLCNQHQRLEVERETETTDGFFYDDVERAAQPSQVKL